MDLVKLGDLISTRRKELGLKIKHLAEKTNISDSTISKLENGKILSPSLIVISRLATELNLNLLHLLLESGFLTEEEASSYCSIKNYEKLNEQERDIVKDLVNSLLSNREKSHNQSR